MNARQAEVERTLERKAQALACLFAPLDAARAVWRGLVLVGDRRSVLAGEMMWALPGGNYGYGDTLALQDPAFRVLSAPSAYWLADQQSALKALQR